MSVSTTIARQTYIGDGSAGGAGAPYSYTFRIFDDADLVLVKRNTSTGAETLLALGTDYTVTGAGSYSGGTFTLVAGNLPSGYELAAFRELDLLQPTDLRNQGSFLAEVHERAFDRFVMMAQQLQDQVNRSIRLPDSEAGGSQMKLPGKEIRLGKQLTFDPVTGDPTVSSPSAAAVSAAMQAVVASATLALARAAMGPWDDALVTAIGGTAARTLANRHAEVINVLDFGADSTGGANSDTAFQAAWAAANASSAAGVTIRIPRGVYALTATPGTITRHRVHIQGDGEYSTLISFNPAAGASLFKFENPVLGNSIYQCSVTGLACISSNTVRKTCFELIDIREFRIQQVAIQDWTSTSSDSVGMLTKGREFLIVDQFSVRADNCIQIKANPATVDISADHFHWSNLYLTGAATTKPLIAIDNDCCVFNFTIDGTNVWAKGSYGLYWAGAGTASTVANSISLSNIRREQEDDATAWVIYIDPSAGCRDISLRNVYGGTTQNGYYFKANRVSLDHVFYSCNNAAKVAINAANVDRFLTVRNCFWQVGPSVVTTGLTLFEGFYDPVDNTSFVAYALYRGASETAGNQGYETHRGAREWVWTGDIATGSGNRLAIPASDTRGRQAAFIQVAGYSATGPIKEGGIVVDYPGLNAAVLVSGTANFGVGNVAGKLTIFNEGGQCTIFNQTGQTLKVVARVVWAV